MPLALTVAYVVLAAGLITLRALVDELDFLSVGWVLLLALVPLVPWLIPALAPIARRVAPFVESVKLPGGVEISLSSAARPAAGLGAVESALTSDHLVQSLPANSAPFTTTDALTVIRGVQAVRTAGAPAALVDLGHGNKWRLPNLYFLAWLLQEDPIARWFVFTEDAGMVAGAFVGTSTAAALRAGIETSYAEYAAVAQGLDFPDPAQQQNMESLTNAFNTIRSGVAPAAGGEVPTLAWVTSLEVRNILGPHLNTASVSWSAQVGRDALETIVRSTAPFVPAITPDRRFRGLIDQREVAVEFAREMLTSR